MWPYKKQLKTHEGSNGENEGQKIHKKYRKQNITGESTSLQFLLQM